MTVPSKKRLCSRIIIEITGFLIISAWLAYIFIFSTDAAKKSLQFKRGFFCDDESLKHPIGMNNLILIKIYRRSNKFTHPISKVLQ